MRFRLPDFDEAMRFEIGEKFLKIRGDGLARDAEFAADGIGDLYVRTSLFQEFEHAGTDKVQPVHLSVKDVQDDSAICVVR